MWQAILELDQNLFYVINQKLVSEPLTYFFSTLTNVQKIPVFWMVLTPLLVYWIYKKRLVAVRSLGAIILVVGMNDLICYWGIKQVSFRVRPNNHPEVASVLRVPYGPQSSSFPSNHASNTFALAHAVTRAVPQAKIPMYTLAVLVGYSRPYVGVHFPLDVIFGAIIGTLVSIAVHFGLNKIGTLFKKISLRLRRKQH